MKFENDSYRWEGERGWRSYRILRPGRGMYHDVKRRLPYYWSDICDGFTYRMFAGTVRMYFVNMLPALAFILDMNHNTGGYYGVNEALLSSALAAVVFSIFAAQPLTIVGITGLISLFNYTTYHIIQMYDTSLYPRFMVWVAIWAAIAHWLTALWNWCDYMRTVTDFSSQTFAMYVGTIYIIKGVEEISVAFYNDRITNGYATGMVAILFTLTVYLLEKLAQTTIFRPGVRKILGDYAYPIATIFWTGFTHIPGNLKRADFARLPISRAFYPTVSRGWLVDFWNLPAKWVFVALPFGLLLTLLFYYDHNVSSLTAQAKQFPLKKPAGFHWDFFLLGCTSFVAGIIGVPLPNGLVPQAPVHTDSLTNYEDQLGTTVTIDRTEIRHVNTVAVSVVEQRLSHFIMALAIIGTMTGPLLIVLHTMPRAVFSGVFFVVGWGSIEGNAIVAKIIYLASEERFIQPNEPLRTVRRRQIVKFISFQLFAVVVCVAISQTVAAIGFPVLIVSLIPLRWFFLPKLFTREELDVLDSLTANNPAVLVSLGGEPKPRTATNSPRGIATPAAAVEDEETGGAGAGGGGTATSTHKDGSGDDDDADLAEKGAVINSDDSSTTKRGGGGAGTDELQSGTQTPTPQEGGGGGATRRFTGNAMRS